MGTARRRAHPRNASAHRRRPPIHGRTPRRLGHRQLPRRPQRLARSPLLFRSEAGDIDGVLATYDTTLHHDQSAKVALEMLDATALLWRLHLDGIDVGDRWTPLADAWADKTEDDSWYVFNDMHAAMAYVGAHRLDHARTLVNRLHDYTSAPRPGVANAAMASDVGLPVCEAILAFGEGRYADAVAALHPIRKIAHRFGGSNTERDAVARTLLEAASRSGNRSLADALIPERLAVKDASPYNRSQLARTQAVGDSTHRQLAASTA